MPLSYITQLQQLTNSCVAQLAAATGQLCAGTIDTDQWAAIVQYILLHSHALASVIGRQHGGDQVPMTPADQDLASSVMADEQPYLDAFAADIKGGKYTIPAESGDGMRLDEAKIGTRVALYANRLTGTANQAWAASLPAETQIWWVLGANEDHCDACPELAAGSPYTPETLPTVPGANDTPCLFNCKCSLQTEGGQSSFPLAVDDEETE